MPDPACPALNFKFKVWAAVWQSWVQMLGALHWDWCNLGHNLSFNCRFIGDLKNPSAGEDQMPVEERLGEGPDLGAVRCRDRTRRWIGMCCRGLWRPGWEGSPFGSVPRVHGTPQLCFSNAIQMKAERGNPVSLGIALKCREQLFLWIVSFGFLAAEWHTMSVSWSICLSFAWLSSSIARHDRFLLLILLVLALEQKFSLWKTFVYAKLSCGWCLWIPKHGLICLNFLDYSWAVYFHLSESCSLSLLVHSYVPAPDFPSGFESSLCGSSETVTWCADGTLGEPERAASWALFSIPTSRNDLSSSSQCHPARGSPP